MYEDGGVLKILGPRESFSEPVRGYFVNWIYDFFFDLIPA